MSIVLDWSAQMAGQVEKPERCVSGVGFMEPWLASYCDKKCLHYSDVECWFCTGGDSIQYTRVDATHRFQREIVAGQAFEIKIVVKPGVCYVAALRAQLAKVQLQSNEYEALSDARNANMLQWMSRYQQEHRDKDEIAFKLQTETDKNAEKMAALTMEWTNLKSRVADLESECREADDTITALYNEEDRLQKELKERDDKIAELHSEKVKYSKDLHDAHVRAQHEHSKYVLRLSKVGMKRSGGAGAVDEDVSEMTDVPDVLDGLNARELGGRTVAWLRNAKAKASQFVQKLGEAEDAIRAGIPDSHICPITCDVMKDPWILKQTGHSYEYEAIKKWLAQVRLDIDDRPLPPKCPKTGLSLTTTELIPNHGLRNSIEEMQARV